MGNVGHSVSARSINGEIGEPDGREDCLEKCRDDLGLGQENRKFKATAPCPLLVFSEFLVGAIKVFSIALACLLLCHWMAFGQGRSPT